MQLIMAHKSTPDKLKQTQGLHYPLLAKWHAQNNVPDS